MDYRIYCKERGENMSLSYHEMEAMVLETNAKLEEIQAYINQLSQIASMKTMTEHDINNATSTLAQYSMALRSCLALAKKLNLPPEIEKAIILIQKFNRVATMLRISLNLLDLATPFGWTLATLRAVVSIGSLGVTVGEYVMEEG